MCQLTRQVLYFLPVYDLIDVAIIIAAPVRTSAETSHSMEVHSVVVKVKSPDSLLYLSF